MMKKPHDHQKKPSRTAQALALVNEGMSIRNAAVIHE